MIHIKRYFIILYCFSIFMLAGCNKQAAFHVESKDNKVRYNIEESIETKEKTKEETKEEIITDIYVHICGAVKVPGVYQLPTGSRIYEAIALAGGFLEEADMNSVNQAELISDQQKIYIKKIGEQNDIDEIESEQQSDHRININMASENELMTLTGIGQTKASNIVAYRESNGKFQSIEDIMKIEGIKEGVFLKIKDDIKVD